jgi:hypothetical protein
MSEGNSFSDLVVQAVTDHGRATADIFHRLGAGEDVDLVKETTECLLNLTRTGAQFLYFWDNIADLAAAPDAGVPLNLPASQPCAQGEIQKFELDMIGAGNVTVSSGLRRRGETAISVPVGGIVVSTTPQGRIEVQVDCSGLMRGLYEGSLTVISAASAAANPVTHLYNVYVDPGAQSP